jgi:hypothetical protein
VHSQPAVGSKGAHAGSDPRPHCAAATARWPRVYAIRAAHSALRHTHTAAEQLWCCGGRWVVCTYGTGVAGARAARTRPVRQAAIGASAQLRPVRTNGSKRATGVRPSTMLPQPDHVCECAAGVGPLMWLRPLSWMLGCDMPGGDVTGPCHRAVARPSPICLGADAGSSSSAS